MTVSRVPLLTSHSNYLNLDAVSIQCNTGYMIFKDVTWALKPDKTNISQPPLCTKYLFKTTPILLK